ncbi:hypothetical protein ACN8ZM_36165 [Burkholderia aenigmatica]|uniref:hypothetical protein n=1 Tax=Burkholderia aenigmatica TaxID=2015348 RepID=UPI003B42D384
MAASLKLLSKRPVGPLRRNGTGSLCNSRANPHALSRYSFRINALEVFEGHPPDIWQRESQKKSHFLRGNRAIFGPIKINPLKRKRIYRAIFGSTGSKMARLPERAKIDTAHEDEKKPRRPNGIQGFLRSFAGSQTICSSHQA